eukprot:PRCOL_00006715-RA
MASRRHAADVDMEGRAARRRAAARPRSPPPSTLDAVADAKGRAAPSTRAAAAAAALYMGTAIALTLFNKAALSAWDFPHARALTLAQLAVALAVLAPARARGALSFWRAGEAPPQYEGCVYLPLEALVACAPLAAAFLAYLLVGMVAVRGVNVPMYTTLRRTAVAFTMAAEFALAGQRFSRETVGAVALIVGGSALAGAADGAFDARGYAMVALSNVATAFYLGVISRLGKKLPLSSFGMMWANAVLCLPGLAVWVVASGELAAVLAYEHLLDPAFLAVVAGSCVLAFAINYAIFLNTTLNTAVTQSVCGNLKDVGTVLVGFFAFGGVPVVAANVAGIAVSIAGSAWYAAIKLREKGGA